MRDFPNLRQDIKEAHQDYRTGRYKTYATLDDILKKEFKLRSEKVIDIS